MGADEGVRMVRKADVPRTALDAALELAATVGWRDLSLRDIAGHAGVTMAQMHGAYPDKGALLDAFTARIDAAVLAGDNAELAAEPAKERLFDVMMRRFDALAPHRDAVRSILRAVSADPCAACARAKSVAASMTWMLEAAGIDSSGLAGRLRVKGLVAIYMDVMRVWLADDSEDMARTMAVLDRRLVLADRVETVLARGFRSRPARAEPAEEAP